MSTFASHPSVDPGVTALWHDLTMCRSRAGTFHVAAVCEAQDGDLGRLLVYRSADAQPPTGGTPQTLETAKVQGASIGVREGLLDLFYVHDQLLYHRVSHNDGIDWSAATQLDFSPTWTIFAAAGDDEFIVPWVRHCFHPKLRGVILLAHPYRASDLNYPESLALGTSDGSGALVWGALTNVDGAFGWTNTHKIIPQPDGTVMNTRGRGGRVRVNGASGYINSTYVTPFRTAAVNWRTGLLVVMFSIHDTSANRRHYRTQCAERNSSSLWALVTRTGVESLVEAFYTGDSQEGHLAIDLLCRKDGAWELLFPNTSNDLEYRICRKLPANVNGAVWS